MDQFSEFPNYDAAGDIHQLRASLEGFFVNEYLITSERDKCILYDSDGVPVVPGPDMPLDEPEEPEIVDGSNSEADPLEGVPAPIKVMMRQEISVTSDVGIFDAISTIPQAAVNLHFRLCWESSRVKQTTWSGIVTKWTYSEVFEVEFKPITVRLLSHERAIIVINMDTGRLNVGANGFDKEYVAPFS